MDHQNCRYLLDSLSDYIDSEIKEELCSEIDRHMEGCDDCRIVVDTLRKTVFLYHDTAEPAVVPDDVRQRLYKRLDLEEYLSKET